MKMHFKKGFSKQVSFKASQSSTSYPLLKTGINVLCRKKYTLVGNFAVCHSAPAREPSMAKQWAVRERELFHCWSQDIFYQHSCKLTRFCFSLCYLGAIVFTCYLKTTASSSSRVLACFFIFFWFRLYNKRIKYLKLLACYFIKCICRRMGIVTVWLSCSIEASNCLVLNSLYLKYAAYFFIYFV